MFTITFISILKEPKILEIWKINCCLVQLVRTTQFPFRLSQGGLYMFFLLQIKNASTFKGILTRAVSTFKAKALGVPAKKILKRGHWFRYSTFQKHYCKDIINLIHGLWARSFAGTATVLQRIDTSLLLDQRQRFTKLN